jgi:hypothetical protein
MPHYRMLMRMFVFRLMNTSGNYSKVILILALALWHRGGGGAVRQVRC